MQELPLVLHSLKEHLKALCHEDVFLLQNSSKMKAAPKKKVETKKVDVFKPAAMTSISPKPCPVLTKISSPPQVKSKPVVENTSLNQFKELIFSINPNFALVDTILSENNIGQAQALLEQSKPITFLKSSKSQKQKEIMVRLNRHTNSISKNTCILDIDSVLNDGLISELLDHEGIQLFIAPSQIFEASPFLKSHLTIVSGKVLKKLKNTALLTIDTSLDPEKSFETIKMCIERLGL